MGTIGAVDGGLVSRGTILHLCKDDGEADDPGLVEEKDDDDGNLASWWNMGDREGRR